MAKIAWIGLGVMGFPMAGHLATKPDHQITVYNRTAQKALDWVTKYGGSSARTPAQAAQDADFILCCVGNDEDLRAVTLGPEGAFAALKKRAIFIDHTTCSATLARELDEQAHKYGAHFFDAPVSGGEKGAQDGTLTVMCGGPEAHFKPAEKLIANFAASCRLMGPAGAGQLTKMVNQITIAGLIQSLSEAIHFAENAGLDVAQVMDVISKGAAQSWQMENRWQTMTNRQFDFGFAVDWMRKDLKICLDEAKRNGAQLPVAELVDRYYAELQKEGGNRLDTSSLITRLNKSP
ncbi:MAG: NAD(P)-dependent oxidoreductase [Hyphomicrobiaceae bacterium]|nr:NAD(P)-dependent oxidoreductase [Hyphomicrobiaceae bacterium]